MAKSSTISPQCCFLARVFDGKKIKSLASNNRADFDALVAAYFHSEQSEREQYRKEIFFKLSPFLLKSLMRYRNCGKGCRANCLIADLLSTAYLVFSKLLDRYDPEKNVDFLGYIIQGLSWGIFNASIKEWRWAKRRVVLSETNCCSTIGAEDIENSLLSICELDQILQHLKTSEKNLFLLHDLFGYTCKELAKIYDKNGKAVQKAIERTRAKIRKEYLSPNV